MLVQQAIFTSTSSGLNAGYQLAARSPGIPDLIAKTLAQWSPSHDSLYDPGPTGCVNFFAVDDHRFSISKTVPAGREYSGREGQRIYTTLFVVDSETFARFANHPFRVMQALVAAGRTSIREDIPTKLEEFPLVGRASAVNEHNLQQVCQQLGPGRLTTLLHAVLQSQNLGVITPIDPVRLFSCLLDLIPPTHRPLFSLTTGLRASLQRPFRLSVLPADRAEQRRVARQLGQQVFDLHETPPAEFAEQQGWAGLIQQLLRDQQQLGPIWKQLEASPSTDLDQIARDSELLLGKIPMQGHTWHSGP